MITLMRMLRQHFERRMIRDNFPLKKREGQPGRYVDSAVEGMWQLWQDGFRFGQAFAKAKADNIDGVFSPEQLMTQSEDITAQLLAMPLHQRRVELRRLQRSNQVIHALVKRRLELRDD